MIAVGPCISLTQSPTSMLVCQVLRVRIMNWKTENIASKIHTGNPRVSRVAGRPSESIFVAQWILDSDVGLYCQWLSMLFTPPLTFLFFLPCSRYLTKAFHMWSRQNKFTSTFINNVMSHVETERAAPAWMLLAKVAGSSPRLDYSKIIESWDNGCRYMCALNCILCSAGRRWGKEQKQSKRAPCFQRQVAVELLHSSSQFCS